MVTIGDMVRVQHALVRPPGHRAAAAPSSAARWAACRCSSGRCATRRWCVARSRIATTTRLSAQAHRLRRGGPPGHHRRPELERRRLLRREALPRLGLAVARMIGHITYLSDESMHEKFGRRLQDKSELRLRLRRRTSRWRATCATRADQFVDRFDANSYLYITKAIDYFDLAANSTAPARPARLRPGRGQVPRHLLHARTGSTRPTSRARSSRP